MKNELLYSANHVYREGWDDGRADTLDDISLVIQSIKGLYDGCPLKLYKKCETTDKCGEYWTAYLVHRAEMIRKHGGDKDQTEQSSNDAAFERGYNAALEEVCTACMSFTGLCNGCPVYDDCDDIVQCAEYWKVALTERIEINRRRREEIELERNHEKER